MDEIIWLNFECGIGLAVDIRVLGQRARGGRIRTAQVLKQTNKKSF